MWQEDLECAKSCLDVLEYCGTFSLTAARFHRALEPFYRELGAQQEEEEANGDVQTLTASSDIFRDHAWLLTMPVHVQASRQKHMASRLLTLLCRPFADCIQNMPHGEQDDLDSIFLTGAVGTFEPHIPGVQGCHPMGTRRMSGSNLKDGNPQRKTRSILPERGISGENTSKGKRAADEPNGEVELGLGLGLGQA